MLEQSKNNEFNNGLVGNESGGNIKMRGMLWHTLEVNQFITAAANEGSSE